MPQLSFVKKLSLISILFERCKKGLKVHSNVTIFNHDLPYLFFFDSTDRLIFSGGYTGPCSQHIFCRLNAEGKRPGLNETFQKWPTLGAPE
jgi:hypothetical protein